VYNVRAANKNSTTPDVGVAYISGFCINMFCNNVEPALGKEALKNIFCTIKLISF
jgi:hypothetical protein